MANYLNSVTAATNDSTWTMWTNAVTTTTDTLATAANTTYNHSQDFVWETWAATREQQQEARKRAIRERREQEEIKARARRLLFRLLDDDEQVEFRRYGAVRVVGQRHIYEIGEGSDLVTVLDKDGQPDHQLCLHPPLHYPKADRLAATLLALRFDEAETVRRGNRQSPMNEHTRGRIVARRFYRAA